MIVKVKKARLFTIESKLDNLLKVLQRKELFMVSGTAKKDSGDLDSLISRTKKLVEYVDSFQGKKPFFDFLEVTDEVYSADYHKSLSLIEEVETKEKNISVKESRNKEIDRQIAELNPFKSLVLETTYLYDTKYVDIITGFISLDKIETLKAFNEANPQYLYEILEDETSQSVKPLILVSTKNESQELKAFLSTIAFKEAKLPVYNKKLVNVIKELLAEKEKNLLVINDVKETFTNNKELLNKLKILYDQLVNQKMRDSVEYQSTDSTIYIDGWVWEEKIEDLKSTIAGSNVTCEVEIRELAEDEVPPTGLKNNKFVKPFEDITNMYSTPSHNELDPNPSMSIWYWIIFGIMMGDIGYGLAMILLCGLFLKIKKPKGSLKNIATIFFYSGFTAILAGIAFGSLFGMDFDLLNMINSNWSSTLTNPVADPMTMLYFSLAFGAVHIVHGLIIKMINCIRAKDYMGAFADAGAWIIVILGAGLLVLFMDNMIIGMIVMGIGLLIVLLFAGRGKKIVGRIVGGLGAVYGISGYLSDILSYSRILALSLSSAVIASTMNMLGGMLSGGMGGFGIVFSVIIWIVGHVFNFVMGLLSAYVHDGRLQYIEFFGKFYDGKGYLFTPLRVELKYINEINNKNMEGK